MFWQPPDDIEAQRERPHSNLISPWLAFNGVAWLCTVKFFSMVNIHEALENANNSNLFKTIATIVSMGHLVFETHARYPLNGRWILLNIFAVSTFIWSYVWISGICSADFSWLRMFIVMQGTIIASRFILDASHGLRVRHPDL